MPAVLILQKLKIMDSRDFVLITYSYIKLTHEHGYEFSYTEIPALYVEAEKSKSPKKESIPFSVFMCKIAKNVECNAPLLPFNF